MAGAHAGRPPDQPAGPRDARDPSTWIWNDLLWPLIFTQSDEKRTIMLGTVLLQGPVRRGVGGQGALSLVASVPTLIALLFFRRYFIQGMTMGAVKG